MSGLGALNEIESHQKTSLISPVLESRFTMKQHSGRLPRPSVGCSSNGRNADKRIGGPLSHLTRWVLDNQTGISFNLVALLYLVHFSIPGAEQHTTKFFTLSYFNSNTGKYGAGQDDICFISFCIVLFTGLRAGSMKYTLDPLARWWGISKGKDITRFSEQSWNLLCYSTFCPLSICIYHQSSHFLNMQELWTDWPQREVDGLMKAYILAELSYYIQQLVILNIEDRRKDHWQMLTHHLVTIPLIYASYAYHQTKVGHLILMLMDVIDLILPLAKCLKYLGFNTACDVMLGVFILSWLLTRHVFYLLTCWSVCVDLPPLISPGCYRGTADSLEGPFSVPDDWAHIFEPFRNSEGIVCFNGNITLGFLVPLLLLQAIMVVWFYLIVRVAVRVLKGGNAEDVRSDSENGDEDAYEEESDYHAILLEEEVGIEEIDLKAWKRRKTSKGVANSSAVTLTGHSNRKELLNRIGCEKQID